MVPQMSRQPAFVYADEPGFVNLSVNVVVCPNRLAAKVLWALLNGPENRARLTASTKRRGANIDLGVACIRRIGLPAALPWPEILAAEAPAPEAVRPAVVAFDAVRRMEAAGAGGEAIDRILMEAEQALVRGAESSRSRR